jgi:protocatechuate 3,4-dioxygenase beta subunit
MTTADSNQAPETGPFFPRDRLWHPPALTPRYKSTVLRSPQRALLSFSNTLSEMTGPVFGQNVLHPLDNDLILNFARPGESAQGPRIIVHGRVLDDSGRPLRRTLVEVWQANAGGRYRHHGDNGVAPIDPNFSGGGRTVTDAEGRYRFVTIKPGSYPWGNHHNAWRPAHIHFSLFGPAFVTRLITQMYFPGDPLFPFDPIFNSVPEAARSRLVSAFDLDAGIPDDSLAFRWDIVLRGPQATPVEQ